ncbi:MAG: aminoacyl-tRNA hydrolase [Myxococcota bacterium]
MGAGHPPLAIVKGWFARWRERRRGPALPPPSKLVVGLGNPGSEYVDTRHNVGFRVLEHWSARAGWSAEETRFRSRYGAGWIQPPVDEGDSSAPLCAAALLPQTYMNRSGEAVVLALEALDIEDVSRDVLLVYDDVDLPLGRLRLRPRGGAGGHRGLVDIFDRLGRSDLPRLRFGVGRPPEGISTADHVLGSFTQPESAQLGHRLDVAAEALDVALHQGVTAAMNRFNREHKADEVA